MTTDPTTGPTTSPTSTATEAESSGTSGPASCAGQPCGTNCEPEMCVEGDCSAYACNDDAQCVPHTGLVCQDQLEACMGHSCGDECFLPCNDDSDGACAATFCDPDGVCVEEALFEMRPCPGGTGTSGGSESGSSTG